MAKLIYATTGVHVLLHNGEPKVIGKIHEITKRLLPGQAMIPVREIWFDFEQNGAIDRFFFVDDTLVYHCIDLSRSDWMTITYQEILEHEGITKKQFLNAVITAYVLKEMGF